MDYFMQQHADSGNSIQEGFVVTVYQCLQFEKAGFQRQQKTHMTHRHLKSSLARNLFPSQSI